MIMNPYRGRLVCLKLKGRYNTERGDGMPDYSPYIVERVPSDRLRGYNGDEELWYCHKKGYDYIPVFGSIGTKKHAESVCRVYNLDGKAHYVRS